MATARTAPAGPHRVHRARPRGGHRLPRRRPRLRVPVLARPVRPRRQRLDGRAPERATRARSCANSLLPLRRPGDLRGVPVHGARPEPGAAAQQRRRRPPRRAVRRRPRRRRRVPRGRASGCWASRPRARAARGSALGLLPGARGACSSSWCRYPERQGLLPHGPEAVSHDATLRRHGAGAASERVAGHLREAILAARSRPGSGSGRRRSPSVSAPAGCRCARRCGCSRPRGSPSTRPTGRPGAPARHARGRRHLPDARAARTARAGREPAAPDAEQIGRLEEVQSGSRRTTASPGSSSWTASSTC